MQSAINDAGVVAGFARHSRNETIGGQQRNSYSHKGKRSLNRFCTVRKRIVALFFDTQHMGGGGKMPACTSMLTRLCAVGLDGCSLMTPAQSPPSPSLCYCCQLLTAAGIFRSVRGMLQLHHSSGEARAVINFPFELRRSNPTTKRGIVVKSQSEKYSFPSSL